MPRRVFLSYKRKSEGGGDTELLADRVEARLVGFDVLRDKEIPPGAEWHRAIDRNLALADGAVALVSPAALASPWVQYELAVLAHRTRRDPAFVFLIACVGGVTPTALTSGCLLAAKLDAFQVFVPQHSAEVVAGVNEYADEVDLIARIRSSLEALPSRPSPGDRLIAEVARRLQADFAGAFDDLEDTLGLPPGPEQDRSRRLGEALLRADLQAMLNVAACLDGERRGPLLAMELLELVFPFWVHAQSAATLASAVDERAGVALPIQEQGEWLVGQCLRRAEIYPHFWRVVDARLPVGEDPDHEEVVLQTLREVARVVDDNPTTGDRAALLESVRDALADRDHFFALVTSAESAEAILRLGQAWLHPIVVGPPVATTPNVRGLRPPLDEGRVTQARKKYQVIRRRLATKETP